jgi:hypothetical protein
VICDGQAATQFIDAADRDAGAHAPI